MIDLGVILLGILVIVFRKQFTKYAKSTQNVKLPEKYENLAGSIKEITYLVTGIIFIIFGLLSYFQK